MKTYKLSSADILYKKNIFCVQQEEDREAPPPPPPDVPHPIPDED